MWALMGGIANASDNVDDLQNVRDLMEARDYEEAMEQVDRYLEQKPGDAEGRFLKGIIFSDQKQFDEAIEIFVSLTEDYPQLPEPYNNLAVLYAGRGKYLKARNALLIAIKTHPSYATAHENLGDIYAMMATEAYNKALELDAGNQSAKTKLGMIRELFPKQIITTGAKEVRLAEQEEIQVEDTVAEAPSPPDMPSSSPTQPPSQPSRPALSPGLKRNVLTAISTWAEAWSNKNVEGYIASYAPNFRPANGLSYSAWKSQRRQRILAPKFIQVTISDPHITTLDNDTVRVQFTQEYRSNTYQDSVTKTIDMVNIEGSWRFIREEFN